MTGDVHQWMKNSSESKWNNNERCNCWCIVHTAQCTQCKNGNIDLENVEREAGRER